MTTGKGVLLFLIRGGMELSWLYAWATFLMMSMLHRPFPFPEAIGTFGLAAFLTLLSKGKGWRIIQILLVQVFGFAAAALRTLYVSYSSPYSFFKLSWMEAFFRMPRPPLDWVILVLISILVFLFWISGVSLARRPASYSKLCSRFDLGLAAFFVLFLAKFLILEKGGGLVDTSSSSFFLFPYFLFSLLGIGMVRNGNTAPKNFLPGYRGIGIILSFALVMLLFGSGLVLFFLPYLTWSAEVGYSILKTVAKPLGPILVSILRFMFMGGTIRQEPSSSGGESSSGPSPSPVETSWWSDLLEKILGWGLMGILALLLLVVCGIALFYLFRWLFSRTSVSARSRRPRHLTPLWTERLRIFLLSCWKALVRQARGYQGAFQLYGALLVWGRHSGLPHFLTETPREYGMRLKDRFPALDREIDLIVEAFNQEVYGQTHLNEERWVAARLAFRRLRSPVHWPARLRAWFFQPANRMNGL
jgi:hypothetical protein